MDVRDYVVNDLRLKIFKSYLIESTHFEKKETKLEQ